MKRHKTKRHSLNYVLSSFSGFCLFNNCVMLVKASVYGDESPSRRRFNYSGATLLTTDQNSLMGGASSPCIMVVIKDPKKKNSALIIVRRWTAARFHERGVISRTQVVIFLLTLDTLLSCAHFTLKSDISSTHRKLNQSHKHTHADIMFSYVFRHVRFLRSYKHCLLNSFVIVNFITLLSLPCAM